MPSKKDRTVLCTCAKCRKCTWIDGAGVVHRGCHLSPGTAKRHQSEGLVSSIQDEERSSAAILLSSLAASSRAGKRKSLAVRPRDLDDEDVVSDSENDDELMEIHGDQDSINNVSHASLLSLAFSC